MRLFVALELPEGERRRLFDQARRRETFGFEGGHLKWVRPENLHVTLKFLGEVPDSQVPLVCETLSVVQVLGPLRLSMEGLAFFPPRGPIRMLVVDVGGDLDRLAALYEAIEQGLELLGVAKEGRAFRPHVTLARAGRDRRPPGVLRELATKHPIQRGEPFAVDSFVLMQSDLKPGGAVYTPVARFPLH